MRVREEQGQGEEEKSAIRHRPRIALGTPAETGNGKRRDRHADFGRLAREHTAFWVQERPSEMAAW